MTLLLSETIFQKVTNTGKEVLCEGCVKGPAVAATNAAVTAPSGPTMATTIASTTSPKRQIEQKQEQKTIKEITSSPTRAATLQHHQETVRKQQQQNGLGKDVDPNECAGCQQQLKEGQALIALDRQWHIWCFK